MYKPSSLIGTDLQAKKQISSSPWGEKGQIESVLLLIDICRRY